MPPRVVRKGKVSLKPPKEKVHVHFKDAVSITELGISSACPSGCYFYFFYGPFKTKTFLQMLPSRIIKWNKQFI